MRRRFRAPRAILARLAALTLAAAAPLAPSAALACDAPETPCSISGPWGEGFYHLALPEGEGPFPVVMTLHGYGGRADATIRGGEFAKALLARGYAVVAPQGMPRREGDTGGSWNAFADPDRRDDVAFLRAVAQDAVSRAPLDPTRIIEAGFSGGGMMVWRTACDAPDSFAAYAPVSGLLWRPLPEACKGAVRLFHTHGWSDVVVPLEGRSVAGGRITQGDLFEGLDILRAANGCTRDDPSAYDRRGEFLIRTWDGCAPGSALSMALFPGGHMVPPGWGDLVIDWFEALGKAPS